MSILARDPLMLDVVGEELAPAMAEVLEQHAKCGDKDPERLLNAIIRDLNRVARPDAYWLWRALKGARPAALKLVGKAIKLAEMSRPKQRSMFDE